jgi:hypothetical protein
MSFSDHLANVDQIRNGELELSPAMQAEWNQLSDALGRVEIDNRFTEEQKEQVRAQIKARAAGIIRAASALPPRCPRSSVPLADDKTNDGKDSRQSVAKSSISREEANLAAMELARQNPAFVDGGVRDWAAAISVATGKTCSISTVMKTQMWTTTMQATGRGKTKGKAPKAISFSENMEAVIGRGDNQEVLNKLIADHNADNEPSPFDDASRKVRCNKRV